MSGVLVHEWLAPTGGSENVFETLAEMFPDARRFALWNDSNGRFEGVDETWLARTPLRGRKAAAVPFMPIAWRGLPAVDADWILASSHVFAHHAKFRGQAATAPKFVYAHTPARYVWVPELDGRGEGLAARAVSAVLKPIDRRRAQEPVSIAANSRFVAQRIAMAWNRDAHVVYPPVDVDAFMHEPQLDADDAAVAAALPERFLLGVSRFVPYKRMDAVIAAGAATGLPVVLAGAGPDEGRLRSLADELHPNRVTFQIRPSTPLLRALYRKAAAVVFATVEDFGIIPVEAMASGTPVVANAVGGAAESVVHGSTGALVHDWSPSSLREAVEIATATSPQASVERALQFSQAAFDRNVREWLREGGVR